MRGYLKTILLVPMLVALVFVLAFSIPDVHATTFTATQSGNWDDPATWGGSSSPITINSGDSVIIPDSISVLIPLGGTITNSGTIINNGTITNPGSIANNGTITNSGTLYSV